MKNTHLNHLLAFTLFLFVGIQVSAESKSTVLSLDAEVKYQKIDGFGGFVNGPQFQFNHMSPDEIRRLWGKDSEAGYNIMRIYIPIGESEWPKVLEHAQLAKSLNVFLFASPWTMPAEWKTNKDTAASAGGSLGYLKKVNYPDYAMYLQKFVTFLRTNGVELDAISIQNEPDMNSKYPGCLWTPDQLADFLKTYGSQIGCKILAAESLGLNYRFADALLKDDVLDSYAIFAGHQYNGVQDLFSLFHPKGKPIWMTEYLQNWNPEGSPVRDFNWERDGFSFARSVNVALTCNVSAWIHYASKRYYALMGDGLHGTVKGEMTKRGYILAHYAKSIIGSTRIKHRWQNRSTNLDGSAYLSAGGDSVVVMLMNTSSDAQPLSIRIPFNTKSYERIATSATQNMYHNNPEGIQETSSPEVVLQPKSFTTLIFRKSSNVPKESVEK